ncbi:MAG: GAF domain-containing protein [Planctomycetes bacterium]|nr:GAF domain-containing protein [Planctomycetota bacterium]
MQAALSQRTSGEEASRADAIFIEHLLELRSATDRIFSFLLMLQWISCIFATIFISPYTWIGTNRAVHIHVWGSLALGAVLTIYPVWLAQYRSGSTRTRHVIAVAQMGWSALLIHVTGGRIETHFHVFGSLAFLSFYRDWKVITTATVVITLDHMFRGIWWPISVFGVAGGGQWRWIEHAGWVVFEDLFLIASCRRSVREIMAIAVRQSGLEFSFRRTEKEVEERTQQLLEAVEEAESTLRESEALRSTVSAHSIVSVTDAFGRITEVNDAFCKISGYSREELIGQNHRIINSGHHPRSFWADMRRIVAGGSVWHGEVCNRAKDGSHYWVNSIIAPFKGADGRIEKYVSIRSDITARKQHERLLKQRAVESDLLHRGAQIASDVQDFNDALQQIVDLICAIGGWPMGHVYFPANDGTGELVSSPIWHFDDPDAFAEFRKVTEQTRFAPGVGMPGRILQSRQTVWIPNVLKDNNFPRAQCCAKLSIKTAFGFPVVENGQVVAVLEFFHPNEVASDENHLAVMQNLGIQLGHVRERKKAADQLAERATLASFAAAIGVALVEPGSLRDGLQRCTDIIVNHLDVASARIWTLDEYDDMLCLQASTGLNTHFDGGDARVPVGTCKIGEIAAERKPHVTNQVIGDPRVCEQEWARREGLVAFAGFPLQIGDDLVGVMALFARQPFSAAILQSLHAIADHISLDIQHKRAETELETRVHQQEVLAALGQFTLSCHDQQAVMQRVVESVADTLGIELCKVLELLPSGDRFLLRAGVGWRDGLVGQATEGAGCDSQAGYTLLAGEPVVVDRLKKETRFSGSPLLLEHNVVSGLSVVIAGTREAPFGVLGAHSTQHRTFTRNDMNFIQAVSHVLAASLQRDRTAELLRQRENLRGVLKAHEQLLGVVGHELRTPLAGLRAMSEFLLDDSGRQSAEFDTFLQGIHDEVIRMSQTVNDLLEVSRLNSGLAQWTWTPAEVSEICDRAMETVQPLVDAKSVSLEKDVQPDDLSMTGDAGAIRRLLVNLLENARKHTPTGSIRLGARESSDAVGRWIEFTVHDSGEGMSADVSARLGEAFALNSGVVGESHVKGSGLGLAICRGIVAAHGGLVSVESAPGKGTRVQVRIRADLEKPAAIDEAAIIISKVKS